METFLNALSEYPILGVLLVSLVVTLFFSLAKKLIKFAVSIAIIIIALAIIMHYMGHDTLPEQGKKVLQKVEKVIP
jgi:ribose/xylose/arabinose/galactoside ABC-type transport system permease subunit